MGLRGVIKIQKIYKGNVSNIKMSSEESDSFHKSMKEG